MQYNFVLYNGSGLWCKQHRCLGAALLRWESGCMEDRDKGCGVGCSVHYTDASGQPYSGDRHQPRCSQNAEANDRYGQLPAAPVTLLLPQSGRPCDLTFPTFPHMQAMFNFHAPTHAPSYPDSPTPFSK